MMAVDNHNRTTANRPRIAGTERELQRQGYWLTAVTNPQTFTFQDENEYTFTPRKVDGGHYDDTISVAIWTRKAVQL